MAYISNGQGYTYGAQTLATIAGITGASAGDTVFCTDFGYRVWTYDGSLWTCDDTVVMVNRSGSTINQWDLVSVQQGGTTTEISCVKAITVGPTVDGEDTRIVGVAVFSATNGANCVIAIKGNYRVNVASATTLGSALTSSLTAGLAQTNAGGFSEGVFGFALQSTAGAGTVNCIINAHKEMN